MNLGRRPSRVSKHILRNWMPLLTLLVGVSVPVHAANIHIDPTIASDCTTTYNAATRTCAGGSALAYRTLAAGLGAASPGDVVLLRGGTYGQLAPSVSGTSAQPITIKNYPAETATITGSVVGLWIIGRTDLIVEGLTVSSATGFCRLEDSTRIILQNNTFQNSTGSGTTAGCKFVRTTHSRVLNNAIINGNDSLLLQDASDRNLVVGNTFTTGRHSQLSIRCSEYNVIRSNTFANSVQKSIEIYDCDSISDAPERFDSTHHNLIEQNRFTQTADSSSYNDYNAIQHGGQETIVRRNVFYNNLGGGLHYNTYSAEATVLYGNRSYHNVFDDNECWAIYGEGENAPNYTDNRVVNSILWRNTDCSGGGSQTNIADADAVAMVNNSLVAADPGFVNAAGRDYRLTAGSAQIDAGAFMTQTRSAGSGTSLPVNDARYFFDGYQITGELGDQIQLQGQTVTVRVTAIDYSTNTLTLSGPLTWTSGQGVHLAYAGSAPDIGAFEFGMTDAPPPTRPSAPRNLRIDNP